MEALKSKFRRKKNSLNIANATKGNGPASKATVEDSNPERGQWGSHIEFILSCVGYSVGLGNIWRFPYLAYKNGGGAFIIPYVISVIIAGLPFYFLELSLGQYSRLGPNCIFGKMAPIFQGIGWGMVVLSVLVALYYNMIVAWVFFYFGSSFASVLPWSHCRNDWNTNDCYSNLEDKYCQDLLNDTQARFYNKTCWNNQDVIKHNINETLQASTTKVWPADEFFNIYVLNHSDSFENFGTLSWRLVICLFCAWVLIFLCLAKGVQSSGKVVYFTATFPYVVILILLIRGCTLPGAVNGLMFYMMPNVTKLQDIQVWKDAAEQMFYSLGPAFGGLITMASYNQFHNNCQRDAILVSVIDSLTSTFAGCAIFSITGYMAYEMKVDIKDVTKSGMGLAFIAYPEAIVRMPVSQLWSVLFFFMLVTLGMDSEFAMLETFTTALMDQFKQLRPYKTAVIGTACIVFFLCGLPLCSQGGVYYFTLLNEYSSGYCLVILAFLECIVVSYFYGIKRFSKDIYMMLGSPLNWYFKISYLVTAPLYMLFLLTITLVFYEPSKYANYTFTPLAEGLGWFISALSLMWLPIFALYRIWKVWKTGKPWVSLIRPSSKWGQHVKENKMVGPQIAIVDTQLDDVKTIKMKL